MAAARAAAGTVGEAMVVAGSAKVLRALSKGAAWAAVVAKAARRVAMALAEAEKEVAAVAAKVQVMAVEVLAAARAEPEEAKAVRTIDSCTYFYHPPTYIPDLVQGMSIGQQHDTRTVDRTGGWMRLY